MPGECGDTYRKAWPNGEKWKPIFSKNTVKRTSCDYDLVLHSQDNQTLEKSLRILKPGGKLISISGPPDAAFAAEIGAPWFIKAIISILSFGVRRKVNQLKVHFSFLFMRAQGQQLGEITKLINRKIIRPVIDKSFPFEKVNEALAYVENGRTKGKVVIKIKWSAFPERLSLPV